VLRQVTVPQPGGQRTDTIDTNAGAAAHADDAVGPISGAGPNR
jgi:hypothetical protein